jgi:hypothetical protein
MPRSTLPPERLSSVATIFAVSDGCDGGARVWCDIDDGDAGGLELMLDIREAGPIQRQVNEVEPRWAALTEGREEGVHGGAVTCQDDE